MFKIFTRAATLYLYAMRFTYSNNNYNNNSNNNDYQKFYNINPS